MLVQDLDIRIIDAATGELLRDPPGVMGRNRHQATYPVGAAPVVHIGGESQDLTAGVPAILLSANGSELAAVAVLELPDRPAEPELPQCWSDDLAHHSGRAPRPPLRAQVQ